MNSGKHLNQVHWWVYHNNQEQFHPLQFCVTEIGYTFVIWSVIPVIIHTSLYIKKFHYVSLVSR